MKPLYLMLPSQNTSNQTIVLDVLTKNVKVEI